MKNRTIILLWGVLLWATSTAMAQVYSLDSCVEMALRHNKELEAARLQVSKYEHKAKSLYANYFPNINAQVMDLYSTMSGDVTMDVASPAAWAMAERLQSWAPTLINEHVKHNLATRMSDKLSFLNQQIDYKVRNIFLTSVTLEQPIYMGGKITAGYRMGRIGLEMARLGRSLAREEVIISVHDAYQLLVKAKEMHRVAICYDSLLLNLEDDVRHAVEQGMASRNEMLKVQVKRNEAELKLRQAENGIRLAQMNLCQVIGLPLQTPVEVRQDEEEAEWQPLPDRDATPYGRTEAQLLDCQVEMARQQVKLEQSARLPQLGVALQGSYINGMRMLGQRLFRDQLAGTAMVSLKVPLYHAGEVRHKVAAAKADLQRQQVEQRNLLEKMDLELMQQANLLDEAWLEWQLRQRHLQQCDENLRISRKSYEVGLETLSDLLTAQVMWQQAYADRAEARYQLRSQWMKWRKAAGEL